MKTRTVWIRAEVNTEFDDIDPVFLALDQFRFEIPSFEIFDDPTTVRLHDLVMEPKA